MRWHAVHLSFNQTCGEYLVLLCKLKWEVLTCVLVSDAVDDQIPSIQQKLCGSALIDIDMQLHMYRELVSIQTMHADTDYAKSRVGVYLSGAPNCLAVEMNREVCMPEMQ